MQWLCQGNTTRLSPSRAPPRSISLRQWSFADLVAALEARDRRRCGMVPPLDGLYLMQVDYEEESGGCAPL